MLIEIHNFITIMCSFALINITLMRQIAMAERKREHDHFYIEQNFYLLYSKLLRIIQITFTIQDIG